MSQVSRRRTLFYKFSCLVKYCNGPARESGDDIPRYFTSESDKEKVEDNQEHKTPVYHVAILTSIFLLFSLLSGVCVCDDIRFNNIT
jgi:hypothetical protein